MFRRMPVGCLSSRRTRARRAARSVRTGPCRRRCSLSAAPLPGERLAVIAVDRRQQAPAVHVGAVGHDHVVHHAIGVDARFEVPAPCAASSEGTRVASQPPLGRGFEQPVQEGTHSVDARLRDSMVAVVVALQVSHCQRCRPFRSCPFLRIGRPRTGHLRARFDRVLMTQSNGPEPARNALIYGKTENNTPDTPTATTANQQHNQHILTYMPGH